MQIKRGTIGALHERVGKKITLRFPEFSLYGDKKITFKQIKSNGDIIQNKVCTEKILSRSRLERCNILKRRYKPLLNARLLFPEVQARVVLLMFANLTCFLSVLTFILSVRVCVYLGRLRIKKRVVSIEELSSCHQALP